jgi:hypothetical protein
MAMPRRGGLTAVSVGLAGGAGTVRRVVAGAAFDPARLYHEDGSLKNIPEMDDDTRASIEIDESMVDGVVCTENQILQYWW